MPGCFCISEKISSELFAQAGLIHGDFNEFNLMSAELTDNASCDARWLCHIYFGPSTPQTVKIARSDSAKIFWPTPCPRPSNQIVNIDHEMFESSEKSVGWGDRTVLNKLVIQGVVIV